MKNIRVPRKQLLFVPVFLLSIFAGSVLVSWGSIMTYKGLEAQRDAAAFSNGQYDSIAWAEFTAQDSNLTHQGPSNDLYNKGMLYVGKVFGTVDEDQQTALFALALYEFQDAYHKAEEKNDTLTMANAASASGATLLRAGLGLQDVDYLQRADVVLVKALALNPNDEKARWNLELLRKLYAEGGSSGGGGGPDTGSGGIDPGQGGL